MRAVVVDHNKTGRLTLGEVPAPEPESGQALIDVAAISLNLGETRRSQVAEDGWRPGWDLAGTVAAAAANGSGPAAGTRVVGFLPSGAWAEQAAVPVDALAPLPDAVNFVQASTLPVAGLTALYSLDRYGDLLGRNVLITGASGGVGHLAIQLARHGGAHVVASIRRPEREELVRRAGAHDVVIGESIVAATPHGPFDVILEAVGAGVLGDALNQLAPGGMCILYGLSAGTDVNFDARAFMTSGGARLYGFILFHEVLASPASGGLARLADLVARGALVPHIEVETSWSDIGIIAQRLLDRQIAGKAVLTVG
jgi:NADPH:quinone reductase-like Zn-dependent oxidoreductase